MKHYLLFSSLLFCYTSLTAQTFIKPLTEQTFTNISYDNSKCKFLEIPSIEVNEKYTIISFSLTRPKELKLKSKSRFWFCIDKKIQLINNDTGKKYSLIRIKGATKCPRKTSVVGKKPVQFKLYFKKVDDTSANYSLIEDDNLMDQNHFNIYNIELK